MRLIPKQMVSLCGKISFFSLWIIHFVLFFSCFRAAGFAVFSLRLSVSTILQQPLPPFAVPHRAAAFYSPFRPLHNISPDRPRQPRRASKSGPLHPRVFSSAICPHDPAARAGQANRRAASWEAPRRPVACTVLTIIFARPVLYALANPRSPGFPFRLPYFAAVYAALKATLRAGSCDFPLLIQIFGLCGRCVWAATRKFTAVFAGWRTRSRFLISFLSGSAIRTGFRLIRCPNPDFLH